MRYEQIHAGNRYEKVDVAAVWPASAQLAPLPLHDIDRPLHADAGRHLPMLHRDPFDRLLVAQALVEGLALVTSDNLLRRYDVNTLDAMK